MSKRRSNLFFREQTCGLNLFGVAQTSKSAVPQVSKPAGVDADLEIGGTAGLETCATLKVELRPHAVLA